MDEFNSNNFNQMNNNQQQPSDNQNIHEEKVEADKVYEPGKDDFNSYNSDFAQQNNRYQPPYSQPIYSQENQIDSKTNSKKKTSIIIICIILAIIVIVAGIIIGLSASSNNDSDNNLFSDSSSDESSANSGEDEITGVNGGKVVVEAKKESGALTTVEIAEIAQKSSVGVIVYSTNTGGYYFGSAQGGDTQSGEGSGVIIKLDNQGDYTYIITCAHVISDKNISVKILLADGTTYDAEVVGIDEQTDIGLLRVKQKSLQKNAATIGKSSDLKVGQGVYAIGNPGGAEFFGSFTSGVISAIGRSLNNSTGYNMECIQHDAAINPGNSGGALFNARGELIGINSSKIASTEYEGMSFAVPIDEAVEVVNNISNHGYVPNRPKLGISYSLAMKYNQAYSMVVQLKELPSGSLVIASISDDSSLKNTNVQQGDMIVSVNGKDLDTADVLLDLIEKGKVGDKLELGICRINSDYSLEEFTVIATLVEDKGTTSSDEEKTTTQVNPYDYFEYFFGQ